MTLSPVIIEIHTNDKDLLSDLRSENMPDIRLSQKVFTCDSPDWIPPVEQILTFILNTANTVALQLLSEWLCDRFKRNEPEKLIVNNITIFNHQEIVNVINNYIHVAGDDQGKNE